MKKSSPLQEKSWSHENTIACVIKEQIGKRIIFSNFMGPLQLFVHKLVIHHPLSWHPIHDLTLESDHELVLIDSRYCTISAILGLLDGVSTVQINPNLRT